MAQKQQTPTKQMNFINSIKKSVGILKLDKKIIKEVAKDKKATTAGILILIIGGIISGIAEKDILLIAITPIMVLVLSYVGIGILHLTAKIFKGKAEFTELYRVLTHASILNWLSIFNLIPLIKTAIAIITSIWGIAINFVAIKNIYKLSTLKTVFVILIPILFFMIIGIIAVAIILATNPEILATLQ